jgi:glycosyltransferase involved in cell wall biosynthesis
MNVLILNHELTPLGGGAGRATHNIAKRLVETGHEVQCLTTNANGAYPVREDRDGYTIHRVPGFRKVSGQNRLGPTFLSYILCGRWRAARILKEFKPDVVHAFFTIPGGLLGIWCKRKAGVPLVVSLRGSDVPGYDPSKRMVNRLVPIIRHIWKKSDAVVALSAGLLELARRTDPLPGATWIHNGVNAADFPKKSWMESGDGTLRLLTVARLEPFKGVDVLLEALAKLLRDGQSGFHLRIIGDGSVRGALESKVVELGLGRYVEFCGSVRPNEMAGVYSGADCLVHPALNEAFGQVLTEAMCCGLPILATCTGGIPEIVKDGTHGWLVPPSDPGALADALARVLAAPYRQLVALGRANADYVRTSFSWDAIASAYAGVYERLKGPSGD